MVKLKQALNKALDYYNQLRIFYEARDKSGMESKGSIVEEILAYINGILQNRKKQPLLLGLKPCDIEEIVGYSKKNLNTSLKSIILKVKYSNLNQTLERRVLILNKF